LVSLSCNDLRGGKESNPQRSWDNKKGSANPELSYSYSSIMSNVVDGVESVLYFQVDSMWVETTSSSLWSELSACVLRWLISCKIWCRIISTYCSMILLLSYVIVDKVPICPYKAQWRCPQSMYRSYCSTCVGVAPSEGWCSALLYSSSFNDLWEVGGEYKMIGIC